MTEGEENSLLAFLQSSKDSSLKNKSVTPPGQTAQGDGSLTVLLEISRFLNIKSRKACRMKSIRINS